MRTISEITAERDAAQDLMRNLREERAALIVAKSPYKVGDEFESAGRRWKVDRVTPNENCAEVWLFCRKWTASKSWSISTTPHIRTVED